MIDRPAAEELIRSVAVYLREKSGGGTTRFEDRVAANALETALRELEFRASLEAKEQERLSHLLGHGGGLETLNSELCDRIFSGTIDAAAWDVREHLWATTLEKMSVDQPTYASYQAELMSEERNPR